jgi:hypothetical protein
MSEFPHEEGAWDLDENEVLDPADSLDGDLTRDPLDDGVALPDHWSRALRHEIEADEEPESLDELLAEEEPDDSADADDESWDVIDPGEARARRNAAVHLIDDDNEADNG